MGARAGHRGVRDRPRPAVGHGLRGRRRGGGDLDRRGGRAPDRIVRRGRLDGEGQLANYWRTHAAGPGGPCSEIFVDRGAQYGPEGGPDVDEDRFMEIWNLVFMQDQVDADLEIVGELPAKNIDTGSSLERVATLLQGEDNVFETDAVPSAARGGRVAVGQAARRGRARRRLAQGDRRARPRDHVPDRRRGAAVERRARLHPAPDAPPRGHALAPARDRGAGPGAVDPPDDRALGRRLSRAAGERGVRPAGRDVGGGAVRGDAPPGTPALRTGRDAERGAQGRCRATTRSSCPTRSGSRCS